MQLESEAGGHLGEVWAFNQVAILPGLIFFSFFTILPGFLFQVIHWRFKEGITTQSAFFFSNLHF